MVRVNNMKKFLNKLWLVLIVAGVSSAANVWPLEFNGIGNTTDQEKETQQAYWNKLMTFKMWGTEGITMGHASTPDVNGAIGVARNGMVFSDGEHNLGGPIYVGGSIDFDTGNDAFLSGPVRVTENFTAGANGNRFYGTYCIEGSASKKQHNLDDDFKNAGEQIGRYAQGGAAKVGMCSYDSVPEVPTYLSIPDVPTTTDLGYATVIGVVGAKSIGQGLTEYIDVPPIKIVGKDTLKMYDLYINGDLVFNAGSKLYIRMESPRSLLRVFLNGTVNAASSSKIQVVYVGEGAQYIGGSWTNVTNPVYVENKEYAGNVLFHCKDDINWSSMNGDAYFQGSFLTLGTLKVGSNLVLAGQLLGNKLEIGYDFKGDDFRYVPFDPPVLQTAEGVKTYLVEGHKQDTVKIALDKEATTLIDFEYCFDFQGTVDGKDPNGLAARADITTADIPLFNGTECVNPGKAYFDVGSKNLRTPIILVANDDKIDEGTDSKPGKETFRIIIQNLNAATLKDGSHDGYITLEISDPDLDPLKFKKDTLHAVNENPLNGTVIDTLRGVHGIVGCPACVYSISDTSHYSDYVTVTDSGYVLVKDSTIFDFEKIQYIDIQVHVEDVDNKMKADTTIIIPIGNVNEDPILEDQEFEVDEHRAPGTVVGTLEWGENDSVPVFRQDVFTAVGGDTAFFAVSPTGVITTKKEFDYETEPDSYTIEVKLADKNDPTLFVIKPVVINIRNVNENPKITTDTISVTENSPKGTVVDTLKAIDYDLDDTVLTWTLINDPSKCFDLSTDGVVTLKCSDIDYEKTPVISIRVKVEDQHGGYDTKIITVNVRDIPSPLIEIVEASNEDSTWAKPEDPIYTNEDSLNVCWEVNRKNMTCGDTTLVPGRNEICKEVCDVEGFEGCAEDCIIVYYSDVSPVVTISAATDANLGGNIYTIVEQTASSDTNVYVKDTVNEITVTIVDNDPQKSKSDTTRFTIPVDLSKKIDVPQKTYDALSNVAKQTVSLDIDNPNTTSTPINGSYIQKTYSAKVAGTEVKVSYVTDKKGNVVKQAIVNEKGKIDSIEVITVSYETVIDGKTVTVSYQADAVTGEALYVDGNGGFIPTKNVDKSSGIFKVSYEYVDAKTGNSVELTYIVDKSGNMVKNPDGDRGYQVSYTYVDKYGNAAKQAVFVVLDQTVPVVEILSPTRMQVIRSNFVNVKWTVDGVEQDTLVLQGLEKGVNTIVRFYKDKAGNEVYDSVVVIMKDSRDIEIAVEQPVTTVSKDKVDEYYAKNPPKKGETFAVSIRNPTTEEEVETLIGGSFKTKEGSGKEPYPGVKGTKHLGPTLVMDVKLPTVNGVSGLATLDDLILPNGKISSKGIGIDTSKLDQNAKEFYEEFTVEEYVSRFCEDGTKIPSDLSQFNLYKSKLRMKIWVYTSLGNFVNFFDFTQELNDPDYTNEAGVLQMFFEMKPDKDGYVHAKNKKLLATGAYVYKVEANLRNQLRCTIPDQSYNPVKNSGDGFGTSTKRMGDVIKSNDELLKPFGYKRPANK